MTDSINQARPEGQLRARSPVDFVRITAIPTGCIVFLAGLYFVFLYLLSGD